LLSITFYIYFDDPTKLFSDLYLAKFVNASTKLFDIYADIKIYMRNVNKFA